MAQRSPEENMWLVPDEVGRASSLVPKAPVAGERRVFEIEIDGGTVRFDPPTSVDVLYEIARHVRARAEHGGRDADAQSFSGAPSALTRASLGALADARAWLAQHAAPFESFAEGRVLNVASGGPVPLDDLAVALEATAERLRQVHRLLALGLPFIGLSEAP